MAGNTVNINLNVRDTGNSIKDRTADASRLNKELEKTVAHSKAASKAMAASENIEYGRGRGSMGATGASARDFANQAQGLGGLVRLYATWAANIFAVTAAFNALREAMNTANMVEGLNQLGAAQGVSLGNMAKRFSDASGGAVTLRESMESVVKATSGGLGEKQIMQLEEVARKASQALGLNMSDAVSRLTRGITKLEPELLDELGLITKTGKAFDDYARKVGKSSEALTDFEKVQAFANAILSEGITKFGAIEIPTNPYDKLAASLKNLGTQVLSIINTVITPLVNLLSASPTALFLGLAAFTASIVRQAIPVLKSWGASLDAAAARSKSFYETQAKSAETARIARIKAIKAERETEFQNLEDRQYKALDRLEKQFETAFDKKRLQQGVRDILVKDIQDITDKEVAHLERLGKRTKLYGDLAQSIKDVKKTNQDIIDLETETNNKINQRAKLLSTAGIAAEKAEQARQRYATSTLISRAYGDVGEAGGRQAFSNLMQGIKDEKLRMIPGILSAIGGSAAIAAGSVGKLFTILNRALGIVGVIFGAYELLAAVFSKNDKEVQRFNDSLEELNQKTETANRTADKYNNTLSLQSIQAKANALDGLAGSIGETVDRLNLADEAASGWNRFMDGFLQMIGMGLQDRFGDAMGPAIIASIRNIDSPELRQQAEEGIANLLNIQDKLSIRTIVEAITGMGDKDAVLDVAEKIKRLFKTISKEAQDAAKPLKAVQDGFRALSTSYQNLANSLLDKSPISIFAQDLAKQAYNMNEALDNTQNRLALLNDLAADTSKISMFPPESQKLIYDEIKVLNQYNDIIRVATELKKGYDKEIADIEGAMPSAASMLPGGAAKRKAGVPDTSRLAELKTLSAEKGAILAETQGKLESLGQGVRDALVVAINAALDLINKTVDIASRKAVIQTQQALLGYLPKTAETVKLATDLELQSIQLRKDELNTTINLINSNDQLRLELELNRLKEEQKRPDIDLEANRRAISEVQQQQLAYTNPEALRTSGQVILPAASQIMQRTAGIRAQNIDLDTQRQMAIIRGQIGQTEAELEARVKREQNTLLDLKTRNAEFFSKNVEFLQASPVEQRQQRIARESQERDQEAIIQTMQLTKELGVLEAVEKAARERGYTKVAEAARNSISSLTTEKVAKEANTKATNDATTSEANRANAIDRVTTELEKQKEVAEMAYRFRELSRSTESGLIQAERDRLEINNSLGNITEQEYITKSRALESLQLEIEYNNKIASIKKQSQDEDENYKARIAALGQGDVAERDRLRGLQLQSQQYYAQVLQSEALLYDAKLRNKQLNESLSERQKGYDRIFKSTFDGLADAITKWAETGKWAGKDLFKSLLNDLLKFELRMQTSMIYQSAIRPSLMSMLPGLTPSSVAAEGSPGFVGPPRPSALGSFYDSAITAFAKGGMFTNSIVNQPTLFKFAKGTGLMGEAGPEAIMPLKRDNQGNLGVRGGGQKTEVVINNYSGVQAEAVESTDSRGNRKVEIMIGEAAASDMARSGSQSQRTMRSTFGLKPQLIRR